MDASVPQQLSLALPAAPHATLADCFVSPPNAWALQSLQAMLGESGFGFLYLYAPAGVGISHWLQALCGEASQQGQSSIYLPLTLLQAHSPEVLQGLEQIELLCIDDIEAVCAEAHWAEALFNLFNRSQALAHKWVVGSHVRPQDLPCSLADLHSRLCCGLSLPLHELNDGEQAALLNWLVQRHRWQITQEALTFILCRAPRSLAALQRVMQQLTQQAIADRRMLTIPYIKQVMGW